MARLGLIELTTDKGKNVSAGGFKFSDMVLDFSTKEGVEGHGHNTNHEACGSGNEGLPDTFGELQLLGSFTAPE